MPDSRAPAPMAGETAEYCFVCGGSVNLVWHGPGPLFNHGASVASPSDGAVLRFDAERVATLYAALRPVARAVHDQPAHAAQSLLRAVCACGHPGIGPDLPLCALLDTLSQRGIA